MKRVEIPLIEGAQYSRLTVIKCLESIGMPGQRLWLFRCECGKEREARVDQVKCGKIKQCRSCVKKARGKSKTSNSAHIAQHPLYGSWSNMHTRCYNTNATYYDNYGGRGIIVCQSWHKFENFVEDMRAKPTPAHTLERKNNDGNYEPDNCVWATMLEQANNRRNNVSSTP